MVTNWSTNEKNTKTVITLKMYLAATTKTQPNKTNGFKNLYKIFNWLFPPTH